MILLEKSHTKIIRQAGLGHGSGLRATRPVLLEASSWRFEAAGSHFSGRNDDRGPLEDVIEDRIRVVSEFCRGGHPATSTEQSAPLMVDALR